MSQMYRRLVHFLIFQMFAPMYTLFKFKGVVAYLENNLYSLEIFSFDLAFL